MKRLLRPSAHLILPGLAVLVVLLRPLSVHAQAEPEATGRPTSESAIAAFAVKPPDEASPFFVNRELAREEMRVNAEAELGGAMQPDGNAMYPSIRGSDEGFSRIFLGFFTNMFASVRLGSGPAKEPAEVKVTPPEFSLADRREVEVSYSVRNHSRKILRLDYPTTQRIEILTTDSSGGVLDRWSDDRAFEPKEGIVFVNPGERIVYTDMVPTREMKAGETYEIVADVVGHPEYTASRPVEPSP